MPDIPAVFAKSDAGVAEVYGAVLSAVSQFGPYAADEKKTSIHLVRDTAFAGVHPRKAYLILNVRLGRALPDGSRWKSEQVSKNRWHHEIKLATPKDLDREVHAFLKEAYQLAG